MQFLVFMLSLHSCNHQFVALVIGTEKSAFAHSQIIRARYKLQSQFIFTPQKSLLA